MIKPARIPLCKNKPQNDSLADSTVEGVYKNEVLTENHGIGK
jgi:hypothetical protein